MRQQSNAGSKNDELNSHKTCKRIDDSIGGNKIICAEQRKRRNSNINNNNCQFSDSNGQHSGTQDDELLIRETHAALKSLSGIWSEGNTTVQTNYTEENPIFPNLFEQKNTRMSPITTTAFSSSETLYHREYYCVNGKPKLNSQSKKPRLNDTKFQSDLTELVGSNTNQTDKLNLQSGKSELTYANNNSHFQTHRTAPGPSFSQSSAFHPPLYENKKSNSFGSMSHAACNYTDSSGYSTYSPLDINASSNGSPERERQFGKTFAKDDDMNAADYKEYTTLQPAGLGSKAASVIQDVTREGVGSVVVMNSMSNATVRSTTSTASNERAFLERPMVSYSPGSSNKGKTILQNECLLHV